MLGVLVWGCSSGGPGPGKPPQRPRGPQSHSGLQARFRKIVSQLETLGAVVLVEQGVPVEVDAGSEGVSSDQLPTVLRLLKQLDTLRRVYLTGQPVNAQHLSLLKGLPKLESLNLDATEVSDADLEVLAQFPALQVVTLRGTQVTPQGVARLRKQVPELLITYSAPSVSEFDELAK